jgi:serine-aspartate repeat-containing protein C/D/E
MNNTKIFTTVLVLVIGLSLSVTSFGSLAGEYVPNPQNPSAPEIGTIKGKVFTDVNGNGIDDDAGNVDYTKVFLNVLRKPGTTQAQFSIQASGVFEFAVPYGEYKLEFSFNNGYVATKKGTLAILNDSDLNPDGKSDYVTISKDIRVVNIGAGIIKPIPNAVLGNYVWNDKNKNGRQDEDERGLQGVNINVIKYGTNTVIATTTSDKNGKYSFSLPAGNYDIVFETPKGFVVTRPNNSFNNDDSNVNSTTGIISNLGLFAGEVNNDYDAGYYELNPPKPSLNNIVQLFNDYIRAVRSGIVRNIEYARNAILEILNVVYGK